MFRLHLGAVVAASAALVACAQVDRRPVAPSGSAVRAMSVPRCDEAAGEATMAGLSAARYFARENLRHQIGASRGYLATQGVRRVRVSPPDVRCEPYRLGGGFYRCVAVARLCGR